MVSTNRPDGDAIPDTDSKPLNCRRYERAFPEKFFRTFGTPFSSQQFPGVVTPVCILTPFQGLCASYYIIAQVYSGRIAVLVIIMPLTYGGEGTRLFLKIRVYSCILMWRRRQKKTGFYDGLNVSGKRRQNAVQ